MRRLFQPRFERLLSRDSNSVTQKAIALALIIAVLASLRVNAIVIAVIGVAGVLIVLAVTRSQRRKTDQVFAFYIAANEVLGDEARRYRFEVADAIKAGERVTRLIPDSPPLSSFALGALYYTVGDFNGAVEHLALAAEEQILKHSVHKRPSRQLRRYVARLRQLERAPEKFAKVIAAIHNLERLHKERGADLLAQSQQQLKRIVESYASESAEQKKLPAVDDGMISPKRQLNSITAPPPISEVLNDVYAD